MAEIFVEQRGQQYVALRDKVIVSTGTTQQDTADRAHQLYPSDVVFGEWGRDKWRVVRRASWFRSGRSSKASPFPHLYSPLVRLLLIHVSGTTKLARLPARRRMVVGSCEGFISPKANFSASSWVGLWVDRTSSPEMTTMTSNASPLLRTLAVRPKLSLLKVDNRELFA